MTYRDTLTPELPAIGDTRYHVEFLSKALAEKLFAERCGDDGSQSLWDVMSQEEVTLHHGCASKADAFAWAKENAARDVFAMPRIEERTFSKQTDDLGNDAGEGWELTSAWEVDGADVVEIANP
jgi:hypothetical protein